MSKRGILALTACVAVVAFAVYMHDRPAGPVAPAAPSTAQRLSVEADAAVAPRAKPAADPTASQTKEVTKVAPADPRLAALAVSPDNGLIEFVPGRDGRIVKEIDKDPSSFGYGKPLREYTYAGDRIVGLTSYVYFADHVQATRTRVSYKPDGSVDHYLQSTNDDYHNGKS